MIVLELPEIRREDYSNPWGPVITGSLRGRVGRVRGLVCVGDVVSRYCLELLDTVEGLILIYDMKTRRFETLERLRVTGFKRIILVNERSTISMEVYRRICDLIDLGNQRVILEVMGEEDMIALPAIACLRDGWAIAYGIPNMGACIVRYSVINTRIAQTRFLQLKPKITSKLTSQS